MKKSMEAAGFRIEATKVKSGIVLRVYPPKGYEAADIMNGSNIQCCHSDGRRPIVFDISTDPNRIGQEMGPAQK